MWFHYTLPVAAGQTEADPAEKILRLTYGVITWISIPWDPGPNYMVKVRLFYHGHQIFPTNPDEAACGAGSVEGGKEHLELFQPPFELKAKGYAPDTVHGHDIIILINVLPEIIAEPWKAQLGLLPRRIEWPIIT